MTAPPAGAASGEASLRALAPVVLAWCRRLGGGAIDPDDAAQEVLCICADKLDRLREPEKRMVWVYAVTRRVVWKHRRRVWWRRWMGPPSPTLVAVGDPETELGDRELQRLVEVLLGRLPDAQREVVVLCLVEGRSDVEVAALTGTPLGTVKSRLRLGRAHVRTLVMTDERFVSLRGLLPSQPEVDDG